MSHRLCRIAPSALILALPVVLAGCFDSHGDLSADAGPGPSDYACECCGVTRLAGSAAECPEVCAPLCADGGIHPSCGARALDLACFDQVRAGVPTTISIVAGLGDDCFCDQDLTCSVRVTGDRALAIDTVICPGIPLCRACEHEAEGSCALPALDEGTWRVVVNGTDALELDVLPADVVPERGSECIRRALPDGCGAIWPAQPFTAGSACHPLRAPAGSRVPIRVYDACGGCDQIGPCEVEVFDDVVRVSATRMSNSCELACPPVCMEREHLCVTPRLEPGVYRVVVDGLAVDESTVIEIGADGDATEVCAGG